MKKNNFLKIFSFSCLFLLTQVAFSQRVKGKVVDADGLGLPYINVLEKGTSNGVSTDDQGMFSVELIKMPTILVF
ncbi:MAG: carboxypeptidase-like regulatory domain-containing protein, partial [Polaribacter sp.]